MLSTETRIILGKEKADELEFYNKHTFKGSTAEEFEKWQDECDKNDIDPCAICPVRHECNFECSIEASKKEEEAQ